MAISRCMKCDSQFFEAKEQSPIGSKFKLIFIQCSSCGGVVGTMNYFDAGILANENKAEIANIKSQLSGIDNNIRNLANRMR